MSAAGGGPGSREVAYRLFATEYDDATLDHSESDEERAPNYVITPTGGRVNRLFVIGVLTEVESVSDDVLRARVVDPTGAFVVYAGQYQPAAKAFLDRADPPSFVSLTGKARTYSPDGSDRVFTSVRPESINEVDAETRDRWTVQAAEQTLERVAIMAAAIDRPERGPDLAAVLREAGVADGHAAGIPLAINHYGTTTGYLDGLRTVAIQAVEVVAGERDEVEPLDLSPAEGGESSVDFAAELGAIETEARVSESTPPEPEADSAVGNVATESTAAAEVEADGPGDFEEFGEPAENDEMYEMDADKRREVEEEFGTEFTAGSEVDQPGEAGIDAGTAPPSDDAVGADVESEGPESAADADPASQADPGGEPEPASEATEEPPGADDDAPVDLESAVVAAMRDLDEGDGALREEVVAAVGDDHNVAEDEVEDAIDEALMSGHCYEPEDGRLKAI